MNTRQAAAPVNPGTVLVHPAHLAGEPELADAWKHEITERRAQAAKIKALLAYKTRKLQENASQHTFTRRAVEKAVTRDAAAVLGVTEAAVRRLLGVAEFLAEKLPRTWESIQTGVIDHERGVKAAQAVEDIAHREDLLSVIDEEIVERAPGENAAVVQKWVTRRVQELDTAGFQDRYDRAQAKRYVRFHHQGDGMSHIEALIPTLVAAQVEQQIHSEARNAPRVTPGGVSAVGAEKEAGQSAVSLERALSERIAAAFIHRLHPQAPDPGPQHCSGQELAVAGPAAQGTEANGAANNDAGSAHTGDSETVSDNSLGTSPGVKIGVLVPVQTLTGDSDAAAISWDLSWALPADTARQIVLDPEADHDWYIVGKNPASEVLTVVHPRQGPGEKPIHQWIASSDPQKENLLARRYRSRTSRDRQRDAVLIRDGQCTQQGCTNPGWQAEIDHIQSYETGGATSGENLRVLCRDCHSIKSHRINAADQSRVSPDNKHPREPDMGQGQVQDVPEWLIPTTSPPEWEVGPP